MVMFDLESFGKWLVISGLGIAIVGGVLWLLSKFPGIRSLPGTLRIERSGFTCVIPILASIVGSILLTIILNLAARLINK